MSSTSSDSLGSYLLAELQTGAGDVTVVTGDEDKVESHWHSCVLSRAEYFKRGLSHGFRENITRKFVFDDVATAHMKAVLESLYGDAPPKDYACTFAPGDYLEVALLSRRLMVPSHIQAAIDADFASSCELSHQSCTKWVDLLAICTSRSLPQFFADNVQSALTRDAWNDEQLTAAECLECIRSCREKSLPAECIRMLAKVFSREVHWGENLFSSMACAYEKDLDDAADLCLDMLPQDMQSFCSGLDCEFNSMGIQEPPDEIIGALVDEIPKAKVLWNVVYQLKLDDTLAQSFAELEPINVELEVETRFGGRRFQAVDVFKKTEVDTAVNTMILHVSLLMRILGAIITLVAPALHQEEGMRRKRNRQE